MAAVPIIVIVCITAIKDAIEDYRRTLLDLEVNNTPTEVLSHWENTNVTQENVSLWRRFKKANTRLLMKINRSIKRQHAKRKAKKMHEDIKLEDSPFGSELGRSTTVNSVYSRDSMAMSDIDGDPFSDSNRMDKYMYNPNVVLDKSRRTPGTARFKRDFWKNVRVGDFVRIRNNDEIPADVVVLATSDTDGACYVETKNLDGETNLKVRQALKCGGGIKHAADCEATKFWIESEAPLPNLYSYNGVAKWNASKKSNSTTDEFDFTDSNTTFESKVKAEPISINNVLLRGCTLRNTEWAIGVVLFTGEDTKIMLNAGITPSKRSRISRELNWSVIYNFILLFVLCFVSGLLNGIEFAKSHTSIDYFEYGMYGGTPPVNGIVTFWAALILYQSLVPISLYISIEIVKTIQAFFIYSDCYMYYEPIDYPCTPKSWNISDDLGQIEYIFSDKTGTLTQNVMEFKKCTIDGMAYGKAYTEALAGLRKREGIDVDEEGDRMQLEIAEDKVDMLSRLREINDNPHVIDDEVTFVSSQFVKDLTDVGQPEQKHANMHFMLSLALCHSVITEPSKIHEGRLDFKAQSPDEAALVATARDMGFSFVGRTNKGILVDVEGNTQEYQVLNTLEFNSTRKRMSAIVKFKAGQDGHDRERIVLMCKGADSVIYSRLKPNEQEVLRKETALHLEQFANEGLRTLCLAEKELTPEEYAEWNERHEVAAAAVINREERMEEVADSIERDLMLIGGTAIEDRLQEGVPESIALLGDAGIKLWVLTGDKVETAINIGFSCNLLDNLMELLVVRVEEHTVEAADKLISEYLYDYFSLVGDEAELEAAKGDHSPPSRTHAIIIDGDSLKLALDDRIRDKFLLLCKQCKSVLCCRVSPAQKAAVVRMVKNSLQVMTLAIGDGANDVAMIQEADVGVGIAGEEGRQAVMSSDYAIGQFRFLTRLVLVHGRWSYKRLAEMIPNFFYKNVVFTFTLFWFGIFTSFDGSYLYEYTFVMFFNLAFTSLPVIIMGILDQDVDDKISLAVPQLYRRGILRQEWNQTKFWVYMADGLYQSFISFFFPFFCYYRGLFEDPSGRPLNHRFWIGIPVCTIAVTACNIYVLLNQCRWDWFSLLIGAISCLLVFFWTGVYSSSIYSTELYGCGGEVYGALIFWAVFLVGLVAALLPRFSWQALQKIFYPRDIDIIREKWLTGEFDELEKDDTAHEIPIPGRKSEAFSRASMSVRKPNVSMDDSYAGNYKRSFEYEDDRPMSPTSKPSRRGSRRISSMFKRNSEDVEGIDYSLRDTHPVDSRSDLVAPDYFNFGKERVRTERHNFDDSSLYPIEDVNTNTNDSDRVMSYVENDDRSHTLGYYRRRSSTAVTPETRKSLDQMRQSMRMEQPPPRESIEGVRASMDLSDLTTAESLMRVMSKD